MKYLAFRFIKPSREEGGRKEQGQGKGGLRNMHISRVKHLKDCFLQLSWDNTGLYTSFGRSFFLFFNLQDLHSQTKYL